MQLQNILALGKKWLWLVLLLAILGSGVGFGIGLLQPRTYEAQSIIFVSTPDRTEYYSKLGDQMMAKAFVAFPRSVAVISATMATLNLKERDLNKFAKMLTVENVRETQYINIIFRDTDPTRAAAVANELAHQTVLLGEKTNSVLGPNDNALQNDIRSLEQQITKKQLEYNNLTNNPDGNIEAINKLTAELIELRGSYTTLLSAYNQFNSARAVFWQRAEVPRTAISTGPNLLILVGMLLGIVISAGAIAYLERGDDILRTPEKIEAVSGLSTFITVKRLPVENRVPVLANVAGAFSEAETEQSSADFALPEVFLHLGAFFQSKEARSVSGEEFGLLLITSPEHGDGKTLNASQIALGLARLGNSIVLLDANLRSPSVHTIFDLPNITGLTDYLARPNAYGLTDLLWPTKQANLQIITVGSAPSGGVGTLASPAMLNLLKVLSERSLVIIDSSAVLHSSEPLILANHCDGVLVVVDANRTTTSQLNQTVQALHHVNSHVLGVILNRADTEE